MAFPPGAIYDPAFAKACLAFTLFFVPALQRKIMMSAPFVKFMGSHLSTESEAATALGGLMIDPKFAKISGRYFDGTREILSSVESRDQAKAEIVWEQARTLAKMTGGP